MAHYPTPAGSLRPATPRALAVAALLALTLALAWAPWAARAVQPDEMLADPALEARAREVSRELRCVVCQNESIDDSNAELAHDLRLLVRERIAAGDSDKQVIDYVVSRYGDFVLLRPPFKPTTWALWFGPAVVLAGGALVLALYMRRRSRADAATGAEVGAAAGAPPPPLTAEEEARLARTVEDYRR
ncbi:MAG: cytochrome c-type biogenesis protein [Rhodospirillales bacterium]